MLGKLKALAAGFVIGLIVAPRSGRESRQLLLDWINEFFETGARRLHALEDELTHRREPITEDDWAAEGIPESGEALP
jgi:hypothetical protein